MLIWKSWAIQYEKKMIMNFVLGKKVIFKYEIVSLKNLRNSSESF